MLLTTCAACAAPLAYDAPRCVRCKIRYCDSTCQHDHWRRGHIARAQLRLATRALGADHSYVLSISEDLASAILYDDKSAAQEKIDAKASLVHTIEAMRRVHGPESAEVRHAQEVLEYARSDEEGSDTEEDA